MKHRSLLCIILAATLINVGLTARSVYVYTTVYGDEAEALGDFATVYGYRAKAGLNSVAVRGVCEGQASTCVGDGAYGGGPLALDNVNVGDDNKNVNASDFGVASVGRAVWANKLSSVLGHNVTCGPQSTCVGESVYVPHWNSIAIGRHATSQREMQISIGSTQEPIREVSFSGGKASIWIGDGDPVLNGPAYNATSGSLYLRTGEPSYTGTRLYVRQGTTWVATY